MFQTFIILSKRIHSLKYLRSTTLESKDIGFRKAEFVAKTHFLLKFWATLKINIQKREGLSNFEKPVFDLSTLNPIVLNPKKNGLRRKSKVSPMDTQIK